MKFILSIFCTIFICANVNAQVTNSSPAAAPCNPCIQFWTDNDGDGYGVSPFIWEDADPNDPPAGYTSQLGDCDDTNPNITYITWYKDGDGDTFGDYSNSIVQCNAPDTTWVLNSLDCNDTDANINPNTIWYANNDGDGYGSNTIVAIQCIQPPFSSINNEDCNDTSSQVTTGSTWYSDSDNDGYGDPNVFLTSCNTPTVGSWVQNSNDQCPTISGSIMGCIVPIASSDNNSGNFGNNMNYIITSSPKIPITNMQSITESKNVTTNITYFDGLGRPMQTIASKQSNTGKDIVTAIEYDSFGRQLKEYLPYASTQNNLAFINIPTVITNLGNQYQTTYNDTNPFSEKELENSPLNRVFKQAAPGNDWAKGSGHEIKFDYQTNTVDDGVLLFNITATWDPAKGLYDIPTSLTFTTYSENQLYKNITFDENTEAEPSESDGSTVEFKDKEGRVVLKRTYENKERHDTYYVYNQYGNLTFVLPPLVDTSAAITNNVLNNLCYQYKYDYRNRLVEKKLPGKQWEFIVYDKLDRVVATGPALAPFPDLQTNQPQNPIVGWMITKYDVFNRPIYTGWEQSTTVTPAGRFAKQNILNGLASCSESKTTTAISIGGVSNIKYTNYVNPTSFYLLSVNYYDNYDFAGAPTTFADVLTQPVYYNNTTKPTGLPTGSWTRALESSSNSSGETSYILYDYKARPIRTYKTNHIGGYTEVLTQLDFTGKPLVKITNHKRAIAGLSGSGTNIPVTTTETFSYSDQDRLIKHTMQVNSETVQVLSESKYDELGQMTTKYIGGKIGEARLQKVDYKYNIRGWLTDINDTEGLYNAPDPTDLFAFKINYNQPENSIGLYNGNISEIFWRSSNDDIKRKYGFAYDELNRLQKATYYKPDAAVALTKSYDEQMEYDKNGNITHLNRNGAQDLPYESPLEIDNLTYKYDNQNNQLRGVHDDSNSLHGFKDKSGSTLNDIDYTYDANGNMLTDANKGITRIKYNHLNLPTEIIFNNNSSKKITYLYNAHGVKLQKMVTNGTSVVTTDYLDGFQHKDAVLQFFPHAEGYVTNTQTLKNDGTRGDNFNYVFNYLDHLGNIRMSYAWDYDLNVLKIIEENNYYPFGLKHTNYNSDLKEYKAVQNETKVELRAIPDDGVSAESNMYKYKYNGKEYQDELGLNWYDYQARNYDPAIGRWMNIDPLAEESRRWSPYNYCYNNPVYFIDPDGMSAVGNGDPEEYKLKALNYDKKTGNYTIKESVSVSNSTTAIVESPFGVKTEVTTSTTTTANFTTVINSKGEVVSKSNVINETVTTSEKQVDNIFDFGKVTSTKTSSSTDNSLTGPVASSMSGNVSPNGEVKVPLKNDQQNFKEMTPDMPGAADGPTGGWGRLGEQAINHVRGTQTQYSDAITKSNRTGELESRDFNSGYTTFVKTLNNIVKKLSN